MVKKAISKLYVNCSFPLKPKAMAASETCQRPATSGVLNPSGSLYYRCPQHEGQLDETTTGAVRFMAVIE